MSESTAPEIPPDQLRILREIADHPGMDLPELAAHIGRQPAATRRRTDALTDAGLITHRQQSTGWPVMVITKAGLSVLQGEETVPAEVGRLREALVDIGRHANRQADALRAEVNRLHAELAEARDLYAGRLCLDITCGCALHSGSKGERA